MYKYTIGLHGLNVMNVCKFHHFLLLSLPGCEPGLLHTEVGNRTTHPFLFQELSPVLVELAVPVLVSRHNAQAAAEEKKKLDEFFAVNFYIRGTYDSAADFKKLDSEIVKLSKPGANRLFYFSLPPSTYESVATMIKATCMSRG